MFIGWWTWNYDAADTDDDEGNNTDGIGNDDDTDESLTSNALAEDGKDSSDSGVLSPNSLTSGVSSGKTLCP